MTDSSNANDAVLLIARAEAEKFLKGQIDRVENLLGQEIGSTYELREAKGNRGNLSKIHEEFLMRNFSNKFYYDEYRGTGKAAAVVFSHEPTLDSLIHGFRNDLNEDRDKIQSLLQRLELGLIPSSPNPATSTANILSTGRASSNDIFIVHGQDGSKDYVELLLRQIRLNPVILEQQPQAGQTIIEKFENHASKAGFAIVLLTPDDMGAKSGELENAKSRARQNVIFELGFFVGKLGRERVCSLYKQGVELPSDYYGVGYIEMDSNANWRFAIAKELKAAEYPVDMSLIPT